MSSIDTVVLDVDGTLVDTVYQHTVLWARAFASVGVDVPQWRLHRAIGMGGDRLVAEVAGDEVERQHGDRVRSEHDEAFGQVIDEIRPLPGAADLLDELRSRGLKVVLASSGIGAQTERLLALVDGDAKSHGWTSSDDVEASKPAPDLLEVALEKVDAGHAVRRRRRGLGRHRGRERGSSEHRPALRWLRRGRAAGAGATGCTSTRRDLLAHLDEALGVRG